MTADVRLLRPGDIITFSSGSTATVLHNPEKMDIFDGAYVVRFKLTDGREDWFPYLQNGMFWRDGNMYWDIVGASPNRITTRPEMKKLGSMWRKKNTEYPWGGWIKA